MKNFLKKYCTSGFFLNAPLVTNALIALVTLPIILKNLSITDYGKWQFILALQTWLVVFSAIDITSASKRGIAKEFNGTFLYGFLARLKLLIPIGIFVFGVAVYLKTLGKNIFSALSTIIGLYLIFGYLFQVSFNEFLIAKKRFKQWCFWQILITSVSMIGSATVAYLTKNIIYFALFQLGSTTVLIWGTWLWTVKKENLIESYKKREIDKECVPYGLKLIPINLVSLTSSQISYFIIGPFFGFANLAVFSIANKLRDKCAGVIKSIYPLLYTEFAKMERKELIRIINRYLTKIGIFSIFLSLAFIGVSWFYIKFFLPRTFSQVILYFAILSLGLLSGVMAIFLHTILESHLRYKELAIIGIIPNLLKILLILILGYFGKIIGICIALTISAWISFGFYYFLTIKRDVAIKFINKHSWLEKISKKY